MSVPGIFVLRRDRKSREGAGAKVKERGREQCRGLIQWSVISRIIEKFNMILELSTW